MFSWIYGKIANVRNNLYEKEILKSFSLGVSTISIGNITVGGTGKTPLVAFVAEVLAGQDEKVCILTRGYGREDAKERVLVSDGKTILAETNKAGDEPLELARKLVGKALVVADANRVSAGNWAREKLGITAFVLDDAFQHRRLKRDLDIVCVDATNPFGNGKMLPSGILREPLSNLNRADAIVITRANLVDDLDNLKSKISQLNPNCPIFVSENKGVGLINLEDFFNQPRTNNRGQMTNDKAFAFCALGNPNNFFNQLRREKFELAATENFPDHYFYKQKDIEKLEEKARKNNAEILLTTAKDAVKLKNLQFELPCFVVENELVFNNESGFRNLIIAATEA